MYICIKNRLNENLTLTKPNERCVLIITLTHKVEMNFDTTLQILF